MCLFTFELFLQWESRMQWNYADLRADLNLHENQLQPRLREMSHSREEREQGGGMKRNISQWSSRMGWMSDEIKQII